MTLQARKLYAAGEPAKAAELLDSWSKKYGEKIQTADFYAVRFLVASLGLVDRETARKVLDHAKRLLRDGMFSNQDGDFETMMHQYYRLLPLTDDEVKRQSAVFVEERKHLK